MLRFIRPCLVSLTLAAFALGCGKSEPNPHAIDVKPDTRLQRAGPANPNQANSPNNQQALP